MTKHKRKVERPKKKPGAPVAHHLTPRMRTAIAAMVEDGKSIEEAAAVAELTTSAIYKALKNSAVREFFFESMKPLRIAAKAQALHALIAEMKGPNAAARVAAARTLLEDDAKAPIASGMPQQPGFSILIVDGRAPQGQVLSNGGVLPIIDARAVAAEEA